MASSGLDHALSTGKIDPVYLLYGQDVISRDRAVARIEGIVPESIREFNHQSCLADDTPPGEVIEHANTMPFGAERRVVVVRGVDRYSGDDLTLLLNYLESPNDRSCLVLVADKPDFRLKFFKTLKEKGRAVAFEAPRRQDMTAWVREAMQRRGQDMTEEAARALIDQLGADLVALDGELEKVSLYAMEKQRIEVSDVRTAARTMPTSNVFELGDALGQQEPGRALSALRDLLLTEHHLPVLYMVIRHFRLLLKAGGLVEKRLGQAEAAKLLGVPPFAVRKYQEQARGLGLENIKKGLARLLEANLTLVTTQAPERLVMEKLMLDLATLRQLRRNRP